MEYLQLANNKRDPVTKKTLVQVIYSFGRADEHAMDKLSRLCRSIARVCGLKIIGIENEVKKVTCELDNNGNLACSKTPSREELESKIKELEHVAGEREKALAKAQEIAHLGNWVLDIAAGTFFWSNETYRIFGLEPDATPEDFWATAHPEDRMMQKKVVEDAFYKHKPYNIDHRIICPDGTERVVNEQAEVFCDENGTLSRIVGTVLDITDRKEAEDILRRHRDNLEDLVKQRTHSLEEANTALRVLVKGREEDRLELEDKMLFNIKNLVSPYLEKLHKSGLG